jgi:Tfp pilus assembly protein PilZ
MSLREKDRQFFLSFESPQAFDAAFERKGSETGFFFHSAGSLSVGDRVILMVHVKSVNNPVFLEGKVIWRRLRPGGPNLPAGVFVGLVDRDRARLDGIVKYLESPGKAERRKYTRFPVNFEAIYSTSKGEFSSRIRNLSVSGAFLRCAGPLLTVGARFPIVLRTDEEKHKEIALNVRVAWLDFFEDTQGMGVVFIRGQSHLKKVRRLIETFEKNLKKSRTQPA